jgi:hypothetical protein
MPITAIYERQISESTILIGAMLLVMVFVGATYLSLLKNMIKALRFWLLLFLPLILIPRILIIAAMVGPYIYLGYLTYQFRKIQRSD